MYCTLYFKYITNFTPNIQLNNTANPSNKKLFTKNFFLIYLISEYLSKSSNLNKFSIVCMPIKTKSISILRAPNRSKSSQISLKLKRYKILLSIQYSLINFLKINYALRFLVLFFKKTYKTLSFFESSVLYIQNLKVTIKYNYNLI